MTGGLEARVEQTPGVASQQGLKHTKGRYEVCGLGDRAFFF
jgi:hypothetical protein